MRSFSHLTNVYFELPCDENTVLKLTQALLSGGFQHERGDFKMNRKKIENYEAPNPLGFNSTESRLRLALQLSHFKLLQLNS